MDFKQWMSAHQFATIADADRFYSELSQEVEKQQRELFSKARLITGCQMKRLQEQKQELELARSFKEKGEWHD